MSKEKKNSQVDDLTVLRRILDNASDPGIESLVLTNKKTLESVRRRLSGDTSRTQYHPRQVSRSYTSLEPRVAVHPKIPVSPQMIPPLPQSEPSPDLPEFELVSATPPTTQPSPLEVTFADEDLFEVEKIEAIVPEFLEVIPKETAQKPVDTEIPTNDNGASRDESTIPEWQPVATEPFVEEPQSPQKLKDESRLEFEPVDLPATPELQEKTLEQEPPVNFFPAELDEMTSKAPSRKQKREAKKLQQKKDKEAKRQRKLELKKLKMEEQQKKQEEKQPCLEQQPLQQPPEDTESKSASRSIDESSQIKVDYTVFKGIESIDDKTAKLLYENGYFSIENVKNATVNDLVQIRGIKRTLAKQIKKEIERKIILTENSEFIPSKQKIAQKKSKEKLMDSSEWESPHPKEKIKKPSTHTPCIYKGYTLYTRETRKRNGKKTTLFFFSRQKPEFSSPSPLPGGYHIVVNKKTGIPYLKKK
jgi:hypothetical protein